MASHAAATRQGPSRPGRLRKRSAFRATLKGGTRWPRDRVVVYVRPTDGDTRVGFVCARDVGGAVVRNRARRVLREAWRAQVPRARGGYDVVLVARPAILESKRDDVLREMEDALGDAGVLSP
jgi:ribonuclease P protein component